MAPDYATKDKWNNFQWGLRMGLEKIKMRHSFVKNPTPQQVESMRCEVANYVEKMHERKLGDVIVTDYTPKPNRYHTTSVKDDKAFFEYSKALKDYNGDASAPRVCQAKEISILERIRNPLPGAVNLEDGSHYYKLEDNELESDEKIEARFEKT